MSAEILHNSINTKNKLKIWIFRITALVFIPAFILVALESTLQILDLGFKTPFYIPKKQNGQIIFQNNPKYTWRFFPPSVARATRPQNITKQKPEDTIRIFMLGASAAQGDPEPSYGITRNLQILLNNKYPQLNFEVYNTAITAINSHVVADIAKDIKGFYPDIYIIYLGNNEVIGPFGAGTVFNKLSKYYSIILFSKWIKKTKIGQLTEKIALIGTNNKEAPKVWRGMEMFLENQVRHDSPELLKTYQHFEKNLHSIIDSANKAGAETILCTVGVNLKDSAPFQSLHKKGLSKTEKENWKVQYDQGVKEYNQQNYQQALQHFTKALKIDSKYANLHYLIAKSQLQLNNSQNAFEHFSLARDYDVLRFRADTNINSIINKVAELEKSKAVRLCDIEKLFFDNSPNGIPGEELFYEHVHMNFTGNYLAAKKIGGQIEQILINQNRLEQKTDWLSEEQTMNQLCWFNFAQLNVMNKLKLRMSQPPFTNQIDHNEQIKKLNKKITELDKSLNQQTLQEEAELHHKVILQRPDDWIIQNYYSHLLFKLNQFQESEEYLQKAISIMPQVAESHFNLGVIHRTNAKFEQALDSFQIALELEPSMDNLHYEMGICYAQLGNFEKMRALFQEGKQFNKRTSISDYYNYLATIYEKNNDPISALESWKTAVEFNPKHPIALSQIGLHYARINQQTQAINYFKKAIEANPNSPENYNNIGTSLMILGNKEEAQKAYQFALKLNPDFSDAKKNLQRLNAQLQKDQNLQIDQIQQWNEKGISLAEKGLTVEAIETFNRGIDQFPESTDLHNNLALAYYNMNNFNSALIHFNKCLELNPQHKTAHYNLALVHEKKQDAESAIRHFKLAVENNPELSMAYQKLAKIFYHQGKHIEAKDLIESAIEKKVSTTELELVLVQLYANSHIGSVRDTIKAVNLAETISQKSNHTNPYHLNILALSYFWNNQAEQAIQTAEKAKKNAAEIGDTKLLNNIQTQLDYYRQYQK